MYRRRLGVRKGTTVGAAWRQWALRLTGPEHRLLLVLLTGSLFDGGEDAERLLAKLARRGPSRSRRVQARTRKRRDKR